MSSGYSTSQTANPNVRVVLIGIGGATCSGKTTLAKHLHRILPDSVIIHQDDFAPPQELIPVRPTYGVQDWDDPEGAIDWSRYASTLRQIKATGRIPPEHASHDHLNEQKDVRLSNDIFSRWRETFHARGHTQGVKTIYGIVDGFLLYWHPDAASLLDVRIFLRVPSKVLKQRRDERSGYHTAVQSDPEGTFWRDPPHYWEQIVFPAYMKAHTNMFVNGDFEHGVLRDDQTDDAPADEEAGGKRKGLILLDAITLGMDDLVQRACEELVRFTDAHPKAVAHIMVEVSPKTV